MSVRTDTVNLVINVNGSAAQNQLNDLRKRAADLTFEMKNNLKKGTEEYIAAASQLKQVNADMSILKQTMGITALSQKELNAELTKLKALKGSMQPFTKEFKDMDAQIKAVESRLYDVRNGVTGLASVFSKVKDEVKQFGVVMLSYLGFQFITSQFQNVIKGAGKLSDQLADIRRVAGLSSDEVNALNKSLSGLDTRTGLSGLRDIALIAGKLGVAKDDIAGFTKAVDMLVVTLGDELGSADEITTKLGKILNVFDGKVTGDNVTRLGNAFVQLANSGVATGGFISDFDQRLSGIAKSANISLGALSGLGAGMEELGSRVESSTTAIQKLLIHIAADIPKAAKIAGQSTEEFGKLFATNATEALLKFSEGLVKNKGAFNEIVASLKDAGEEGARVVETISKMGASGDMLRQRIALGESSIKETSAIMEGFALKNETLGASLDKLGKDFYRFVFGSGVSDFLKGAVENTIEFIKWLKDLPTFIERNRITIAALATTFIFFNKQLIISNALWLLNKAQVIATAIANGAAAAATLVYRAALFSLAVVQALVTGNITKARTAWIALNTAFKASPIGAIIALVVALGVALDSMISKISAMKQAQEDLATKAIDNYSDQVNKVEQLKKALESETTSYQQKKEILKELIAINPQFAETLRLDAEGHLYGAESITEYIKALKKKGEAEAAQALSNEQNKEILKLQQLRSEWEKSEKFSAQARKKMIDDLDLQIKKLQQVKDFYDGKVIGNIPTTNEFTLPADTKIPGSAPTEDPSVAARRAALQKMIDDLKAKYELLNATDIAGQKSNLALQKKYQAELDALDHKEQKAKSKNGEYARLLKEAEAFYKQIQKLKQDAINASKSDDEKELMQIQQKYQELQAKALEFFKKNIISRGKYNEEVKLLHEAFNQELSNLQKKQFDKTSAEEYADSLKASDDYFAEKKRKVERDYAEGKIDKDEYEKSLTQIEALAVKNRVTISKDYAATVKKAAEDNKNFINAQEEFITKNLQHQKELRVALLQEEAKAARDIRNIQINDPQTSPKQRNQLQKKNATEDKASAIADLKARLKEAGQAYDDSSVAMTEESVDIWAKYNEKIKKADEELNNWRLQNMGFFANEALNITSSLITALDNLDQRALQKDKALNDAKKNNYKKQLDSKLISQKQYDKKVAEADAEMDKKKHEAEIKAFKRKQLLSISEALINGALAIQKTYAEFGFPIATPFAIAMGIETLAQVAAIATQAPPEAAEGNWFRKGKKHKDGGIPVIIEQNEAVIKSDTMSDQNEYTVTGTPAQITSKLNSMHGGVNWAGGATLQPKFMQRPAQLNPNLPRIMEQGGIVRQMNSSPQMGNNNELMKQLLAKQDELITEVKNQKERLHAVVSIKEYRETEKQYDNAKKASGMSQ